MCCIVFPETFLCFYVFCLRGEYDVYRLFCFHRIVPSVNVHVRSEPVNKTAAGGVKC